MARWILPALALLAATAAGCGSALRPPVVPTAVLRAAHPTGATIPTPTTLPAVLPTVAPSPLGPTPRAVAFPSAMMTARSVAPPAPPDPTATNPSAPAPAAAKPIPTTVTASMPRPRATPLVVTAPPTIAVFLDPGHGGVDAGTTGYRPDGTPVYEKNLTLAIALKVATILRQAGIGVALSRTTDTLPGAGPGDYTSDGQALTIQGELRDLQRRINLANASGARVFLSIHLNSYADPSVGGAETFYDPDRPFGPANLHFATLVQSSLIASLRAQGYVTPDRGATDDTTLQTEALGALSVTYEHLVLLGPGVVGELRPTTMPGALSEPLFLSDPAEAAAAVQPAMQDLLAQAYARAIEQFLGPTAAPTA